MRCTYKQFLYMVSCSECGLIANRLVDRQKPSLRRLTGSKSSSRQGIRSSSSTLGPGLVQPPL